MARHFRSMLFLPALLFSVGSFANEFERGNSAYAAGNYEEAYRIWLPSAEAGDARAQFGIGSLYDRGEGLAMNYFLSASWFQKSARQGLPIAQFNLGNAYHHGRGVAQDDSEAVRLWQLAAEQGLPSAQYNLGTQYYLGLGVEKDPIEARRWYQRAADKGHPGARRLLASPGSLQAEPVTDLVAEIPEAILDADKLPPPMSEPVKTLSRIAPVSGTQMYSADWLLERNPEHLTLQLAVMSEETRIVVFIRRHHITGLLSYFPVQRDGKTLYVLTSGLFADRPAALQGVERLPAAVRSARPWIRRLADIQQQIRASDSD